MQTVIMSFVRGMTHGEQILPINDLFVYLPVQLLPALVESIGQRGFDRAEVKSGWGYRPRKEGAEDNPLLVAGVYSKEVAYGNEPPMSSLMRTLMSLAQELSPICTTSASRGRDSNPFCAWQSPILISANSAFCLGIALLKIA